MKIKSVLSLLIVFFTATTLKANPVVESLHSAGKMGAVIAVAGIIFAGLIGYMIMLDRKLSRMEKEMKNKE